MDDLISRQAAIDALGEKPLAWTEGEYELGLQNQWQSDVDALNGLPSAQPERMTNRQWIDFLSAQFDISRTSAKEMLHGMMQWKKEDNFKKLFNGGQDETD